MDEYNGWIKFAFNFNGDECDSDNNLTTVEIAEKVEGPFFLSSEGVFWCTCGEVLKGGINQ